MPYEDNSFDVVVVGWVLAYTDKVQEAIKEFVRVSKNAAECLLLANSPPGIVAPPASLPDIDAL